MTWNIFVDGDNIPVQRYVDHIAADARKYTNGVDVPPVIYCQSNLVFKYKPNIEFNVTFKCCHTKHKNATDSRILVDTGKAMQRGEKVIIVSNDKIFREMASDGVIVMTYDFPKQNKLRKNTLLKIVRDFKATESPSEDLYISDLLEHFPMYKMERIRNYIQNMPELEINQNDGVYLTPYAQ